MALSDRLQRFVMRTSPYQPFRWIYAIVYGAMLGWLMIQVRREPQIKRLEWRTPSPGHRYGISDLDVRAETARLNTEQYFRLCARLSGFLRPRSHWRRILDFYVFGPDEWQLQRCLGPTSFGSSRMVRLLGSKRSAVESTPDPPAPNALLCRAMYEYENLLELLFEEALTIPFTWTVFRRFKRIDNAYAAKRLKVSNEDLRMREDLISRAVSIAAGAPLNQMQDSDIEQLFCIALAEADALCEDAMKCDLVSRDSTFEPISISIPPDNLADAIDSCSPGVIALCSRIGNYVQSAILGCVPASTFEYRLYFVLREDLSISERATVFRAIRAEYRSEGSYGRIRNQYLRLRYPMVLTPTMWRAASCWYHALRPVEEFYFFTRHGVVLWGRDLRAELTKPSANDLMRSAGIAVADLRNLIWEAVHDQGPRRMIDILTGRIPALWLLLARSMIATSSEEALAGCAAFGFPEVEIIQELRTHTVGKSPKNLPQATDPIWKPALEASSKWIDDIAALALAQIGSNPQSTAKLKGLKPDSRS
jgi:hypothetical protein